METDTAHTTLAAQPSEEKVPFQQLINNEQQQHELAATIFIRADPSHENDVIPADVAHRALANIRFYVDDNSSGSSAQRNASRVSEERVNTFLNARRQATHEESYSLEQFKTLVSDFVRSAGAQSAQGTGGGARTPSRNLLVSPKAQLTHTFNSPMGSAMYRSSVLGSNSSVGGFASPGEIAHQHLQELKNKMALIRELRQSNISQVKHIQEEIASSLQASRVGTQSIVIDTQRSPQKWQFSSQVQQVTLGASKGTLIEDVSDQKQIIEPQLREKQQQIDTLHLVLSARDKEIERLNRLLKDKDRQISTLREQIDAQGSVEPAEEAANDQAAIEQQVAANLIDDAAGEASPAAQVVLEAPQVQRQVREINLVDLLPQQIKRGEADDAQEIGSERDADPTVQEQNTDDAPSDTPASGDADDNGNARDSESSEKTYESTDRIAEVPPEVRNALIVNGVLQAMAVALCVLIFYNMFDENRARTPFSANQCR